MRAGLAFLMVVQVVVGGWIMVAPRSFYTNPLVHMNMPYNGHLLLDYGAMNLAMAVLLVFALRRPALVVPALWVYLVHSTLHLAIHIGYARLMPAWQAVTVLSALGVLVVFPALLLVGARRAASRESR